MTKSPARRIAIAAIKWLISGGIIGYLIWRATSEGTFDPLFDRPKNWWALAAAFGIALSCIVVAAFRWWILVRRLDFPLRLTEAIRLVMMGYVVSYLSFGMAGEDLFKAFFLAHRHGKGRRTAAFATVLVDRLLGLFALFLLASIGVLLNRTWDGKHGPTVEYLSRFTLATCAAMALAIAVGLTPLVANLRVAHQLRRVPLIGEILHNLVLAMIQYRQKPATLALVVAIGLVIHASLCLVIYLVALGLAISPPPLQTHLVIAPLSFLVFLVPLPLGALDALEFAFSYLYREIGHNDYGLLVILGDRAVKLPVLMVSALAYATRSPEADDALHEAEEAETAE